MNKECIHIETKCRGTINNELKGIEGKFPDQWGIIWLRDAYQKDIPSHYYWTDKSKILISN